ncbi:MAG: hypothetical protein KKG99_02300 [Bacteroidetes bacterium]|nr:hypothetical protein [Bacteroidota bacterium]
MERKDFLKKAALTCMTCCGFIPLMANKLLEDDSNKRLGKPDNWISDLEKRMIKGSESPDWHKVEKTGKWIKAMMDNMDSMLDDDIKIKLMQSCGRSCYIGAFGVASSEKPKKEEADRYIQFLKDGGNEVKEDDNKTIITFNWGKDHQNPWGLIMSDGYCMCPLVENGPPDLSPTYCYCSSGYVKEIFERYTGRVVEKVEVLDSLKMGGNDCVFRISLLKNIL